MKTSFAFNSIMISLIICLLSFSFAGCDNNNPVNYENDNTTEPADSSNVIDTEFRKSPIVHFDVNDFHLMLEKTGEIMDGALITDDGERIGVIFSAGLWLAVNNGSDISANLIWCGTNPNGNYTADRQDSAIGIYYVPNNYTNQEAVSWPTEYGAPVDADGNVKIYGDLMCWQSLISDTRISGGIFRNPVEGLRINQAVYGYRGAELENVIFIRYEITNLSGEDWNEVYTGFHSDTDFYNSCNVTGYDMESSLTYTYLSDEGDYCEGGAPATGFTFLETPNSIGVTAHRIMRRNNYINPEFGEYDMNRPEQVLWALQGLDKYGQPMINPITGEQTNFAFTGDPVTQTGWLDTPVDVRSLLAAGPFTLANNETKILTVVWIVADEETMPESIQKLKTQLSQIKEDEELWKF